MVPYQHMTADVQDHPGRIIEQDLVQDKINVTFEWGPIAGYYAKKIKNPELVVIPMKSEPGIKFDFRFTMATRFGDKAGDEGGDKQKPGGDHKGKGRKGRR